MAVKRQVKKTFRNVAQGLGGQNRRTSKQSKVVLNLGMLSYTFNSHHLGGRDKQRSRSAWSTMVSPYKQNYTKTQTTEKEVVMKERSGHDPERNMCKSCRVGQETERVQKPMLKRFEGRRKSFWILPP